MKGPACRAGEGSEKGCYQRGLMSLARGVGLTDPRLCFTADRWVRKVSPRSAGAG